MPQRTIKAVIPEVRARFLFGYDPRCLTKDRSARYISRLLPRANNRLASPVCRPRGGPSGKPDGSRNPLQSWHQRSWLAPKSPNSRAFVEWHEPST